MAETFGEHLRELRERDHRSIPQFAHGLGVSKSTLRAWEDGTMVPTSVEFKKLTTQYPRLEQWGRWLIEVRNGERRGYPEPKPQAAQDAPMPLVEVKWAPPPTPPEVTRVPTPPPPPPEPVQPPPEPPKAYETAPDTTAWNVALKDEMAREEVSEKYLAGILKLSQPAVTQWLSGRNRPTEYNWKRLCDLFPRLLHVASPVTLRQPRPEAPSINTSLRDQLTEMTSPAPTTKLNGKEVPLVMAGAIAAKPPTVMPKLPVIEYKQPREKEDVSIEKPPAAPGIDPDLILDVAKLLVELNGDTAFRSKAIGMLKIAQRANFSVEHLLKMLGG